MAAVAAPRDWLDPLYRPGLPPWLAGCGITAVFVALAALAAALTGERPAPGEAWLRVREVRLGLSLAALAGLIPTLQRYLWAAAARHLTELEQRLAAHGIATPRPPLWRPRRPWLPRAVALAILPFIGFAVDRDPGLYLRSEYWHVGNAWTWSLGLFVAWTGAGLATASFGVARLFSELAGRLERVELFARDWVAPFANVGLACSLVWVAGPALFAVNLVEAPFAAALPLVALPCAAVGTAALLLPTRGVRRRLHEARDRELAAVHRALRGDAAALADTELAARGGPPSVADLVSYAGYVRAVPTSPFTQQGWLRFALYLLLPFGSWLGGALVERGLGLVLGG